MYVIVFLFIALSGCYGLTYCLLLLCLWRRMSMDRVSLSLRLKKKKIFWTLQNLQMTQFFLYWHLKNTLYT
jgi:hypothetical protein